MRKSKVAILVVIFVLTSCFVCGCSSKDSSSSLDKESIVVTQSEKPYIEKDEESSEVGNIEQKENPDESGMQNSLATSNPSDNDVKHDFTFSDVADKRFWFGSGVGAWYTTLRIQEDGTFFAEYYDCEYGDTGENYPEGTVYYCEFDGEFGELTKISDYIYSTNISILHVVDNVGKEEITDGERTIYTEPYGLKDSKKIYFYLPGASKDQLPKEFVDSACYGEEEKSKTELSFYGMYNENAQCGFYSEDVEHKEIDDELSDLSTLAKDLEDQIYKGDLAQLDMNQLSYQLYQMWDDELNSLWYRLKAQTEKKTMEKLVVSERKWIVYKEKEIKKAKEDNDGTLGVLVENIKGAALTKVRVYKLADELRDMTE